jgi:PAS domain S-box-containing protein
MTRSQSVTRLTAAAVLVTGCSVLLGWALDIDFLRRIVPGLVAMNPATAVAFVLAAASLWLRYDENRPFPLRVAVACAGAVALIGLLKLCALLGGPDARVDQWLFAAKLDAGGTVGFPNRMAPNTAFNFLLLGGALLLLDVKTPRRVYLAQFFVLAVALTSLLAVIGYAFSTGAFYQVGAFIPMALHTALAFLMLAVGILGALSHAGITKIFTSRGLGGIVARRLLPAAVLVPVVLGWLRLEGQRAGLYGTAVGVSLTVTVSIFLFVVLIGWTASALERTDAERRLAAEALRETARELEAAHQANQRILDYSLDVICTIDEAGRFVQVSAACEKIWGYAPAELVGREYIELVCPEDVPQTNQAAQNIVSGAAISDFENRHISKDGVLVAMNWSAVWSEADKVMFCVARDNTARKQAEIEIQTAREKAEQSQAEAERANAAKSEFLSRTSHELRTPLNAILGFAQLMEMDDLDEGHRDGVRQILKGGRHLLELVNEVLDIASIDAGRMALSVEPVQLSRLAQETIALVQPLADERHIRFENNIGGGYVKADQQRLNQVLLNLLSNAVKYNREGGTVRLASGTAAEPGRVRFEVTDTGPGIAPAGLDKLFLPFERLNAPQMGVEGTGIGLTISRRLVQVMDGEIGVYSVEGEGTTFWVELPGAQDPVQASERREALAPGWAAANGTEHTLLYIEDNLSNLSLIEHILARRGKVRLLSAMQGRRGLELARENRPDLILLDLHLPDMQGDEVLHQLRAETETKDIPVVMLSADATPRQIERLLEAGAKEFLTKPLDVKRFLHILDETMQQGASTHDR